MTVKELIKKLERQEGDLPVRMFAVDQDERFHDEGEGDVKAVRFTVNDHHERFVALHA